MSTAARRPRNKWLITLSVSFGTLMGAIDSSIVNVALSHIRGSVGASVQEITWITTGYALATVLVMPLTAFLARLFGQKRVYLTCLVLFLVGSALCGIARSLTTLIIYRAIQGFGAGALQPTEQAILRQTFPPKEQGTAMAIFGMAVMLGPALGPTLGGLIVDNYSWPWIFYINIPVGIVGFFMVSAFVEEDPEILEANRELAAAQRKHIDWAGITLLSVGLCTLQYFLEEGQQNDWFNDRTISVCFIVCLVSLSFFVLRELTAKVPVVNLRLFTDKTFLSGTLIGALMFAMLIANMFLLPVFMQDLLGFTATQSGLALMPRTLVMMMMSPIVGRIYNHVPVRMLVSMGVGFFCLGCWQMSHFTLEITSASIVSAIILQGIGFSFLFVPLTTVALSSIPRANISDATGLNSLLRQIGGSVGLAVFVTFLERYTREGRFSLSAHLARVRPEVTERLAMMAGGFSGRGGEGGAPHEMALLALDNLMTRQATLLAFDRLFLLSGILFLAILPLLIFLKQPKYTDLGPISLEH